jgi:hypothetical protein
MTREAFNRSRCRDFRLQDLLNMKKLRELIENCERGSVSIRVFLDVEEKPA